MGNPAAERHEREAALVCLAKSGQQKAARELFARYTPMIRSCARSYYLMGADAEDLMQEGSIGLYKAICDYRPEKHVSFSAFAGLCITRQMVSAVKAASRQKHVPLNSYISLHKPPPGEAEGAPPLDSLFPADELFNPEQRLITKETGRLIQALIGKTLSNLEQQVLDQHLQGKTYRDTAVLLQRSEKSVDNAMQRIKKKLSKQLGALREAGDF